MLEIRWLIVGLLSLAPTAVAADVAVDATITDLGTAGTMQQYGLHGHLSDDKGGVGAHLRFAKTPLQTWASVGASGFTRLRSNWIVGGDLHVGSGRDLLSKRRFPYMDGSAFVNWIPNQTWQGKLSSRFVTIDDLETVLLGAGFAVRTGNWSLEPNVQTSAGDERTRLAGLKLARYSGVGPFAGVAYGDTAAGLTDLGGIRRVRVGQAYAGWALTIGRYRATVALEVGRVDHAERAAVSLALGHRGR